MCPRQTFFLHIKRLSTTPFESKRGRGCHLKARVLFSQLTMKPIFFVGLALALSVPAWSQPQGPPPPARGDRPAPVEGGPQDGSPQVGGPIQLQNPHRRGPMAGGGQGPMMGGGQGGGFPSDFPGASGGSYNGGRNGFFGDNTIPMLVPAPVAMFADERFLFVLRGDTLMQFDKKTLALLKSVELPRPIGSEAPPRPFLGGSGQGGASVPGDQLRSQTSPPLVRRGEGHVGSVGPTF